MKNDLWIKLGIAGVAIALAILRIFIRDTATENLDTTLLVLFVTAVVVLIVPWERMKYFNVNNG